MPIAVVRSVVQAGISLALLAQAGAEDGKSNTLIERGPHGTAVITQSGGPTTATTKIERKPHTTTITRKNGGNSTTIIQGTDTGDLPSDLMTPNMRRLWERMQK